MTGKQESKAAGKARQDDLWSRIKTIAEKEDISYLVAIEKWQGHIKKEIS